MVKVFETEKFKRLRKKIKEKFESESLKQAVGEVSKNILHGKKLNGEFRDLRSFRYFVRGQSRRLIYRATGETLVLYSFGPREGIYKHLNPEH